MYIQNILYLCIVFQVERRDKYTEKNDEEKDCYGIRRREAPTGGVRLQELDHGEVGTELQDQLGTGEADKDLRGEDDGKESDGILTNNK